MAGACRDHRDRGREHPCAPGLYAIWSAVGIAPVAVFGKILFNDGKGRFCYPDNATRYYASKWPKTAPKLFDMTNSICQYDALPQSDVPPSFPCKGCPATKS